MEIETALNGKLKIPDKFVRIFNDEKQRALKKNEDEDFWDQNIEDCFCEWLYDVIDPYKKYYGKICSKDIAEFLVSYETGNIDSGGGYPIENWFCFEDNGFRYFVCAFGWTSSCSESKGNLDMIGYKEKI